MSAQNNTYGTNNNNEQEGQEVEAAVGRAYVQGGDGSGDERPPVTTTQDLETAQPEEAFVATQLDVLAREQEESVGSSTEGTAWHLLEASGSRLGNGYGHERWSKTRAHAKLEFHRQVVRAVWQQAGTS